MTQKEFDGMGMLLKPGEVGAVLGLDRRAVRKLRRARKGIAMQVPGETEWKFYKCEIAKLARLEYR